MLFYKMSEWHMLQTSLTLLCNKGDVKYENDIFL